MTRASLIQLVFTLGVVVVVGPFRAEAGTPLAAASFENCQRLLSLTATVRPGVGEPDRPLVSVVIPSFNGRPHLGPLLRSIEENAPRVPTEIIVADDASIDGTPEWLRDQHPSVRLVRLNKNGGFVAAANAGIAASRGEIIEALNNDTVVKPGWVDKGIAPFSDPRVGAVSPLVLLHSQPHLVDSAGDSYSPILGWAFRRGRLQPAELWRAKGEGPVLSADGAAAFYRRSALEKVGLFDPYFGAYFEDVDLSLRLRHAGYTVRFAPESEVLHKVSSSYDHSSPELQRKTSRNSEILFWSDLPTAWLAVAAPAHLALLAARAVYRASRGAALGPFFSGQWDALKDWKTILQRRRKVMGLREDSVVEPELPMDAIAWRELLRQKRGIEKKEAPIVSP